MAWLAQLRQTVRRWLIDLARRVYARLFLIWQRFAADHPDSRPVSVLGPNGLRKVATLSELDVELAKAKTAFAISDDAGRKALSEFAYAPSVVWPTDPYSPEYHETQMRLYRHISGRANYSPAANEQSNFDLEQAKLRPFPYATQSAATVGDQLMAQGFLIRAMGLPAGARVVEFGPGWGNLTLQMAQMGYAVTAVEIEPKFIELIRDRAARLGQTIELVQCDMLEFRPAQVYDAAVFFEAFHHCSDHLRLLRQLSSMVTNAGVLVFAAEPIAHFPHPWGIVRTDGMTLWSMREWGWLELGFNTSYFLRTLLYFGWLPKRFWSEVNHSTDVFVARRGQGRYEPHHVTLPPDEEATWSVVGEDYRLVSHHSVMSCVRDAPVASVTFSVSNLSRQTLTTKFWAGSHAETVVMPGGKQRLDIVVPVKDWRGQVAIAAAREARLAVHSFEINP